MYNKPKKVKYDSTMSVIDIEQPKSKTKPREIDNFYFMEQIAKRELTIPNTDYFERFYNMTREQFANLSDAEQLKFIRVRSGRKMDVVTEDQLKSKQASKFGEDTIVRKWAKDFKVKYPGIPYNIDKVAQKRSNYAGQLHKSAAYMSGHPDIHIPVSRGQFKALYIEQKVSDDVFYQNTRILKPGSDNHHIWQSLYHADLREQGNWVMFSISLEATIKMVDRYMAGNPYTQQIFEYYCKPEDYGQFEFHKHFKPVKERP